MNFPQPGQPEPYFLAMASVRSTPATLAMVASQARTSANSPRRSSWVPLRREVASSPISSMSQRKVPSTPRAWSFSKYILWMRAWRSARETLGGVAGWGAADWDGALVTGGVSSGGGQESKDGYDYE